MTHISPFDENLLSNFGPLNPIEVEILKTVAKRGSYALTKEELAAELGLDTSPADRLRFDYHFNRLPYYFIGQGAPIDGPDRRMRVSIHPVGVAYLMKSGLL